MGYMETTQTDNEREQTLDDFCCEIDKVIVEILREDASAPTDDVIREVVNGMILGEDEDVQIEIRRRYKI